jgi:hypothetical protein
MKNRILATIMSLLVPGLGQIIKEQYKKGLIFMFGQIGIVIFILLIAMLGIDSWITDGLAYIAFVAAPLFWIYNVFDAFTK